MHASDAAPGWFRRHFNEDYRIIYRGRDQCQADAEAAAMVREVGIHRGDRVLDLCCGYGRHLTAFARHGIQAVGVDLSKSLLAQVERGPERRVVCADMRSLPFPGGPGAFTVVLNFFTSFGYFESDEENLQAAREIARVLAPRGRFAMDLMNAEPTIEALAGRTERKVGPFRVVETRTHDAQRRRIEKRVELFDEACGTAKHYVESIRVFSPDEIRTLLRSAGLEVKRMLGDFCGSAHGPRSERMIVLGRRGE